MQCEHCGQETGPKIIPPSSREAEESVVGGILIHPRKLLDVAPLVSADDFYFPAPRAIYAAMLELDAMSQPIDTLTVAERLKATDGMRVLANDGNADYLDKLISQGIAIQNLDTHARLIRTKADRRRWGARLHEMMLAAYGGGPDAEFFERAGQGMIEMTAPRDADEGKPKTMKQVFARYMEVVGQRAKARKETGSGITGIRTTYEKVDMILSGLHPGQLIVIAGRPTMGKTSFALNVVIRAAGRVLTAMVPSLVFSLEMPDDEVAERLVSSEGRIDSLRLRQGDMELQHWTRMTSAVAKLVELPIEVIDRGTITLPEIRAIARRWRMAHKVIDGRRAPAIIVVDYLQLVKASNKKGQSREQEVSEISRGLKALAKDLDCPVIALSQLNRDLEKRPDKRPNMSDLRESGAIEQDADVIAFIYRDEVYSKEQCADEDRGVAEFIIAKQRMGPTATVRMTFIAPFTRFEPISTRSAP